MSIKVKMPSETFKYQMACKALELYKQWLREGRIFYYETVNECGRNRTYLNNFSAPAAYMLWKHTTLRAWLEEEIVQGNDIKGCYASHWLEDEVREDVYKELLRINGVSQEEAEDLEYFIYVNEFIGDVQCYTDVFVVSTLEGATAFDERVIEPSYVR
ncbi:hypothetical protein [Paenibacillus caui]|uniref:hypothetical protein n=1 Tax=Paenibacillus caui TaxID=2873927 RepID=UPI001CAA0BD5|nr:hypothetical protein [Paenibacillus caui]